MQIKFYSIKKNEMAIFKSKQKKFEGDLRPGCEHWYKP